MVSEENAKCNAGSVTLLCLVQCLISYRSFSTTLYSVSVIVSCIHETIKPGKTNIHNLTVSVHNSLWDFGNTLVKISVVLEIEENSERHGS